MYRAVVRDSEEGEGMNYARSFVIGFVKMLGAMAAISLYLIGMFWPMAFIAPESPFFVLAFVWMFAFLGATIYADRVSE